MKKTFRLRIRVSLLISLIVLAALASTRQHADTGLCGGQMTNLPFIDVASSPFFCQIAEAYIAGLTNGTTSTTYSPSQSVPREQMAAFVTRTLDQSIHRNNRRAALGQWWTSLKGFGVPVGATPNFAVSDGTVVYVSNSGSNNISRIDARTGQPLPVYTGVPSPQGMLVFDSILYICSFQSPGRVYAVTLGTDGGAAAPIPTVPPLGDKTGSITTDGRYLWTANFASGPGSGSISRIDLTWPDTAKPSFTFSDGFSAPESILFDGTYLWVTDFGDQTLKRVSALDGSVLQTVQLSGALGFMTFDGENIWVPSSGPDQVFVVRAVGGLQGTIVATLTGNFLSQPTAAAFDGERVVVTNYTSPNTIPSVWRATDLAPLHTVVIAQSSLGMTGACSDGTNFWVTLATGGFGGGGGAVRF